MFFVSEFGIDPIRAALFSTFERALDPHLLLEEVFIKVAGSSASPANFELGLNITSAEKKGLAGALNSSLYRC